MKTIRPDPKPTTIRKGGRAYRQLQVLVLRRDNFTCQKCGRHTLAPPHHIIKRSQGGSDTMDNLVTLCMDCHEREHR